MQDLIIDSTMMIPHFKHLIKNSLYYSYDINKLKLIWNGGEDNNNFLLKYGFDRDIEISDINNYLEQGNKFNNIYFGISILSTQLQHQGQGYKPWVKMYVELYEEFKNAFTGKMIIVDHHDGDYEPTQFLNQLEITHDIVLKRVYSCSQQNKYNEKTFSYPFTMTTNNDPLYPLLSKNIEYRDTDDKISKIIWCGNLFKHIDVWGDTNEVCNRIDIYNRISKKYPEIIDSKKVPYHKFNNLLNSYKYILDLRGASRHNKRFLEGINTSSLIMAETIDIIWPFEDSDSFSPECFFTNEDDLYEKIMTLENDNELYEKCLNNQIYIRNKYFTKEWLYNYIVKIIN